MTGSHAGTGVDFANNLLAKWRCCGMPHVQLALDQDPAAFFLRPLPPLRNDVDFRFRQHPRRPFAPRAVRMSRNRRRPAIHQGPPPDVPKRWPRGRPGPRPALLQSDGRPAAGISGAAVRHRGRADSSLAWDGWLRPIHAPGWRGGLPLLQRRDPRPPIGIPLPAKFEFPPHHESRVPPVLKRPTTRSGFASRRKCHAAQAACPILAFAAGAAPAG